MFPMVIPQGAAAKSYPTRDFNFRYGILGNMRVIAQPNPRVGFMLNRLMKTAMRLPKHDPLSGLRNKVDCYT